MLSDESVGPAGPKAVSIIHNTCYADGTPLIYISSEDTIVREQGYGCCTGIVHPSLDWMRIAPSMDIFFLAQT